MKFLQVNYTRELPKSDPTQAEGMRQAAEKISGVPGLLWKIWTYDDDAQLAGGFYLFETEEQARAFGDGPMEASLSSHPGIASITKRYYDVDEDLSAITRGPISSPEG